MASLSVRKLDDDVYQQLRVRAANHGVSMESEVRQILIQAVAAPERISEIFKEHFGSQNGVELRFPDRHKPHQPMDFNE